MPNSRDCKIQERDKEREREKVNWRDCCVRCSNATAAIGIKLHVQCFSQRRRGRFSAPDLAGEFGSHGRGRGCGTECGTVSGYSHTASTELEDKLFRPRVKDLIRLRIIQYLLAVG